MEAIYAIMGAIALAAPVTAGQQAPDAAGSADAAGATIEWQSGELTKSLARAELAGQPLLLYFWMDGSQHCQNLWGQTLTQPAAVTALQQFVCHSADVATPAGSKLVQRFGIETLPSLLVVTANGAVDDAMLGFVPLAAFLSEAQRITNGTGTVTALRAAVDAAPDDLDRRFALGQKLEFVGDEAAGDAMFQSIRAADPEGRTTPGAELLLFDIRNQILDRASDRNDPATWDLAPLYRRLRQTKQPTVLWKGWSFLSRIEGERGAPREQVAAYAAAWPHAPAVERDEWGSDVVENLWSRRDTVRAAGRKLAREIARTLAAHADAPAADPAGNGRKPPTGEQRAFFLASAARGMALGGRRRAALDLVAKARELTPDDATLEQLQQQIERR